MTSGLLRFGKIAEPGPLPRAMRNGRLLAACLAVALAFFTPHAYAEEAVEGEIESSFNDAALEAQAVAQGQDLVEKHCSRCHAIGSKDASPHDAAPAFRTIARRYPPEHLAEALAEGIETGHPDMPVFIFEPPQIDAFLAFLGSLVPEDER